MAIMYKQDSLLGLRLQRKFAALLQSRRFYAAVVALLTVLFHEQVGFSEEVTRNIIYILISWIVGDSLCKTEIKP